MDRSRWSEINRIFHAALEVEPAARQALVAAQSHGDARIQSEVEQLLAADSEAGEYLEAPLIPAEALAAADSPLAPGDVLCGRFRIVREIAEGGMGHVFEAFDTELAVPIALKVIRPEIAANPEVAARFRQEVRLARSITHPNVCRTFDLERETRVEDGKKTDLVFLTMEFLPGETLSARIERAGPMPFAEALAIARQVAAALQAAHSLGIVHRDMKPSNIMLVGFPGKQPAERAVVTDFGLARLEPVLTAPEGEASLTRAGSTIGTLAYMAPEQLEGAPVSPATDLYAFGLVLFEMVSGQRAFPSRNLLSGIAQRMRGSTSLEQQLSPETPPGWRTAIRACLQVQPRDRPQDADAVVAMLEGNGWAMPQFRFFSARGRHMLPRAGALFAVFLIALALFAGGLRLYESKADSRVAPGALVFLTQVKNVTGEKSLDNLTELLQAGLSQSTQVNLLDQGRVGDILQQMTRSPNSPIDQSDAREIAMRGGAARVVFATAKGSKGSYTLQVEVQQPDSGSPKRYRNHWSRSFAWHTDASAPPSATIPQDLLTAIRDASDWIRNEAGESKDDIARLDVPPDDATTSNWEALEEFGAAESLQSRQKPAEAIVALKSAVQIDPNFSLAYGRLGDLLVQVRRYEEGYEAYARSLATDQDRRLSRKERDRIRGSYALDSHDFAAAEEAYRDYVAFYGSDYRGWFYQGYPLEMLDRVDEAVANLKKAYSIDPTKGNAPYELARSFIAKGDFPQALQWAGILKQQGNDGRWNYFRGVIAFLSHDYDGARQAFTAIQQSRRADYHSLSRFALAQLAAETGDAPGALAILEQGLQEDRSQGNRANQADKLLAKAYLESRLGNFALARQDVDNAVTIDASPPRVILASSILGAATSKAGARDAAALSQQTAGLERILPAADFGVISELARHRVRGEILLAKGAAAEALIEFRTASQLDSPIAGREYLGRTLEVLARSERDPQKARDLRVKAMDAYGCVALHPHAVWLQSGELLPGEYGDQLSSYVRLALATAATGSNVDAAVRELAVLRRQPFNSSSELKQALLKLNATQPSQ
jgi:tetratricopeptide (TPR) repeat protein